MSIFQIYCNIIALSHRIIYLFVYLEIRFTVPIIRDIMAIQIQIYP